MIRLTQLAGAFACALALVVSAAGPSRAAGEAPKLAAQDWSFQGVFGTFDRASVQRGFKVYKDVCAACHSLHYVAFRNLTSIGFSEAEARAIAASYTVPGEPDDAGDPTTRPARLSDRFPPTYANANAARAANGGALPPDLSLITKARVGGPDYLYGILTGYTPPPAGVKVPDGQYYNAAFPGHLLAMPAPLSDGQVEYADGTRATVSQMAKDVTYFLHWAAEPNLEARHQLGLQVLAFLILLTILFWFVKQKVWRNIEH
jgi:ubiquinol-cytochrome c reductase cytochrome c1 subunit